MNQNPEGESSALREAQALRRRLRETEARLAEAEETLRAIRSGEVDALVVSTLEGERVFTLEGAEATYRFLVEEMNEGALLLAPDGTVLYSNARFADFIRQPLEQVIGSRWHQFFMAADQPRLERLLTGANSGCAREEFLLLTEGGPPRPVGLSLRSLRGHQVQGFSVVVTDLTERRTAEAALREANEALEQRVRQRTAQLTRANESLLSEMGERKRTEAELRRQREWLGVTLTSIGDAVLACDPQGRISFMNPAAVALTGWTAQEALGQAFGSVVRIIDERTRQPADNIVTRVLQQQRMLGLANHSTLLSRDGREIPIEDSAAPIRDGAGAVTGVVIVFQDATQKRLAEQALRLSEERQRLAQKAGQVGIFDWDLVTNQVFWTPEQEELFGLAPGTFENRYEAWAARVHPEDLSKLEQLVHEWLRSNRPTAQWEYRQIRPGGEERWMAARGQVFRDATGKPLRVVGTNVDVTERKQVEALLNRSRLELERLVTERTAKLQEMIGELQHVSYSIVHDMRAPLRAIQGFASLLQTEPSDSADRVEYYQRIIEATKRIDMQITDALQYTKAVLQQLPLQAVDLGQLLSSLLRSYPALHTGKATIELQDRLPVVLGNESLLTQCFSNLLDNAVKFVAPGTRPEVRVRAERLADRTRIWIEDNGIGIPKYAHGQLFGMFQRLTKGYEGTGIGLAIVRKVVERMGGKVGVESEEGKGSRFWVELRVPLLPEPLPLPSAHEPGQPH